MLYIYILPLSNTRYYTSSSTIPYMTSKDDSGGGA